MKFATSKSFVVSNPVFVIYGTQVLYCNPCVPCYLHYSLYVFMVQFDFFMASLVLTNNLITIIFKIHISCFGNLVALFQLPKGMWAEIYLLALPISL